jgi:hypothetical protein
VSAARIGRAAIPDRTGTHDALAGSKEIAMKSNLGIAGLLSASCLLALLAYDRASAQGDVPYCDDLKRVLAAGGENPPFGSITGKREGNASYAETTVPLRTWKECNIYPKAKPQETSYQCESTESVSQQAAAELIKKIASDVQFCLGNAWRQRSSNGRDVVFENSSSPVHANLFLYENSRKTFNALFRFSQ